MGEARLKIRTYFDPTGSSGGKAACWRAVIVDQPNKREAGVTEADAVGKLVISHPELFGGAIVERDESSLPPEPTYLRTSEPTD